MIKKLMSFIALLLLLTAILATITPTNAQEPADARVIVQTESETVIKRDITFANSVTGLEALSLTGLEVITNAFSFGVSVCSIEGVGCPADNCFCQCTGDGPCNFWNYLEGQTDGWHSYDVGPSDITVTDGSIQGWAWGEFGSAPPTDEGQVIVQSSPTESVIRPIAFLEPVSGLEALSLTGLDVITNASDFGVTVCSINGVGCPADNCFCGCPIGGDSCAYWSYNAWEETEWQAYGGGADSSIITNGAIEGWLWQSQQNPALHPATLSLAAEKGLTWLRQQQAADGGYGSEGTTAEVLMSLGANQLDPTAWRTESTSPSILSYMLSHGPKLANSQIAGAGKLAVSLTGVDGAWPVGAKKPLDYLAARSFSEAAGPQSWAILGTIALSQTLPAEAVTTLINLANDDGGWAWFKGDDSDSNATALAIQALVASGQAVDTPAILKGLAYLKTAHHEDGGFSYTVADSESDTNSTAYAVQAIVAVGQDPLTGTWVISGNTPISFLLARQQADGSFAWTASNAGDSQLSTQQAVPALLYRTLPYKIQPLANAGLVVDIAANVSRAAVGETITYTYRLTNTGEIVLNNLTAQDNRLGVITLTETSLAAGAGTMAVMQYTISMSDTAMMTNTVMVKGRMATIADDLTASATTVVKIGTWTDTYLPILLK